MAQTAGISGLVKISSKTDFYLIISIQPMGCSDPEHAIAAFANRMNIIMTQTVWIFRLMQITSELFRLGIKSVQTRVGPNPKNSLAAFIERRNVIIAQTLRIVRLILEMDELIARVDIFIEAARKGSNPQHIIPVL